MLALPVRLLLSILLACAAWPAIAGPLEDGLAAYKDDDYETALRLLSPLAEKGEAAAQWSLGIMYANGQGVALDSATGLSWLRKAAAQGYADAEFTLGVLHENGFGVPQSNGEAASWYRKAAERGHAAAQYNLGVMHEYGNGVARDLVQAHLWLTLSVARLDPSLESQMRTVAIESVDRVAAKMTPVQLAEAARLARDWKPRSP